MSWHGFKKAVNRAGIQMMQKAGVVEKTDDCEFTGEERKLSDIEKQISAQQKQGKQVLDAMHTLASSQIVEDLQELGLEAGEMPRFKEMWRMMEELVCNEVDPAYRQVLLQPSVRLGEAVKKGQEAVKKRANKLLDYDQAKSKTKRADPVKRERALAEEESCRKLFEQLDGALKHDLPLLYGVVEGILVESEQAGCRLQGLLEREIADGLHIIPDPPRRTTRHQDDMQAAMATIRSLRIAN